MLKLHCILDVQSTQKYQRGQVRGLGFGATPTQLEAHIRSTGKVKELQNQLQAQSERMSVLEKNYEHLTAALLKQCQQVNDYMIMHIYM